MMDHAARAKKALAGLMYSPRPGNGAADETVIGGTSPAGAPADAALLSLLADFQVQHHAARSTIMLQDFAQMKHAVHDLQLPAC